MSMHLINVRTGSPKAKKKFRSAEEAAKARAAQKSWNDLLERHAVAPKKNTKFQEYKPQPISYRGSDQPRIPSLATTMDPCVKPQDKVYTGNNIIGIGTLHKSNAVPIFSQEQAIEIARMRR